ncbi:MAG: IPT/TIG domain-containing protein, partial [Planctomycetota bacterium]|nr:IPT/TIG domain-containing protein [Planctomycetota bacterium]
MIESARFFFSDNERALQTRSRHWIAMMSPQKIIASLLLLTLCACGGGGGGGGGGAVFLSTAPVINSIAPNSALPGASVVIAGINFDSRQNSVTFAGMTAMATANSSNSLTVTVPNVAPGVVDVVVTTGNQSSAASSFVVLGQPVINSLSPSAAAVGETVVINGQNFDPTAANNTIQVNGVTVPAIAGNGTTLTFEVPNFDATGSPFPVNVSVGALTSNNSNLTINVAGPIPVVSSLSPSNANPGDNIVVTGSNFSVLNGRTDLYNTVFFGSTAVAAQSGGTSTALTVTVPNLNSGNVTVTVVSEGKASSTSQIFTVGQAAPAPSLNNLSPNSGLVGATVTINGQNFNNTPGNNSVNFGGTVVTPSAASPTQLTVTVPNLAPGAASVTVTTGGQTSNALSFTVTSPSPSISSLNPSSGPVGSSVVIAGQNFSAVANNNTVTVGGVAATVSNASANSLTITIPSVAAGSQSVVVTVGGQSATANFNVTVAPAPGSGFTTGGGALTNDTLSVTINDEVAGTPLNGATVQVSSAGGTVTATTNASGVATFANQTGPVTLTAGLSGFALTSLVDVDATTVNMLLEPLATNRTITGTIALPD